MWNCKPIYIPTSEYKYPDDYFFHGGYAELYAYKFEKYLSGVSKYLMDKKLKDIPYEGID